MTAAVSHSPEPYEVPDGGLASFLTATVGDWSDEALNADNYYDVVKPTADQLAAFGREEDDRIAHVATGETVIPMAVFEEDPALKEALFARMREMGIDPERYVVGNELNSINPVTGQPEFFLKKIFKGIKKAVKGVVKVFKKIAPIVLSIGGAALFGPLGAALGSGIGTLIQGGNLKDAFKSALISGVTAGVTQGIGQGFESAGALEKGATFGQKLSAGLEGFGQSLGEGLGLVEGTSYLDQFGSAQGIFNPTGREVPAPIETGKPAFDAVADTTAAKTAAAKTAADVKTKAFATVGQEAPSAGLYGTPEYKAFVDAKTQAPSAGLYGTPEYKAFVDAKAKTVTDAAGKTQLKLDPSAPAGDAATTTVDAAGTAADAAGTAADGVTLSSVGDITAAVREAADPGFFASIRDFFTTGNLDALKQAFLPGTKPEVILQRLKEAGFNVSTEVATEIAEKLAPTAFRRFAPSALGIMGLTAATGGFEQPEMGELDDMYPFNRESVPYPFAAPGSGYKPLAAARGGDIQSFPRKNGPIYGPGTETSDDIPAMLSDGEFVMTAKAVRGAGNGNRQAGMRKMYDMMRTFEGAV